MSPVNVFGVDVPCKRFRKIPANVSKSKGKYIHVSSCSEFHQEVHRSRKIIVQPNLSSCKTIRKVMVIALFVCVFLFLLFVCFFGDEGVKVVSAILKRSFLSSKLKYLKATIQSLRLYCFTTTTASYKVSRCDGIIPI